MKGEVIGDLQADGAVKINKGTRWVDVEINFGSSRPIASFEAPNGRFVVNEETADLLARRERAHSSIDVLKKKGVI